MAGGFTAAVIQSGRRRMPQVVEATWRALLSQAQGSRLLPSCRRSRVARATRRPRVTEAMAVAVVFGVVLPAALDGSGLPDDREQYGSGRA